MPTDPVPAAAANPPERIPIMQRILDNPFLLLFLGVTLPNVLYIPAVSCRSGSIPSRPKTRVCTKPSEHISIDRLHKPGNFFAL